MNDRQRIRRKMGFDKFYYPDLERQVFMNTRSDTQFRIIYVLNDGTESPSCGVWPTREAAEDIANRHKAELIGPSSVMFVREEPVIVS